MPGPRMTTALKAMSTHFDNSGLGLIFWIGKCVPTGGDGDSILALYNLTFGIHDPNLSFDGLGQAHRLSFRN